jgi:hypothetical protein
MAKEWILNNVMNRFQLNYVRNVGAVSEAIRACSPNDLEEWREYYYTKVHSKEEIDELGRKLYIKITEVIEAEIKGVSEEDCINYMHEMVIDRTYDGYMTEITTIYGQLQQHFSVSIEPASDEWDRKYNVDFFIQVDNNKYIGIQIKPVSKTQLSQIYKERDIQSRSHRSFQNEFGGRVFYVFSIKESGKKVIYNPEVVQEIKAEIDRLQS